MLIKAQEYILHKMPLLYVSEGMHISMIFKYLKNKKYYGKRDCKLLEDTIKKYPILYANIRDYFELDIELQYCVMDEDIKNIYIKIKLDEKELIICPVKKLDIGWNRKITDDGIKHMNLHTFNVSGGLCKITDEGRSSYVSKTPMAFFR